MKKILIAPDSFKECLTAKQVANCIASGIKKANPNIEIKSIPIADGGEGFVDAIINAVNGYILNTNSVDALMRPINSFYGVINNNTAIIEMASASGIHLIKHEERNPLITSTFGTGLLIKSALENGFKNIIIGIGGSVTNDCGMGMAQALGYKFLDKNKKEVGNGGIELSKIEFIDNTNIHPLLASANIIIASDVKNILCGPNGASFVFGPQKGASVEDIILLDKNLLHFARIIKNILHKDIENIEGAGAAGGLGGGLLAFTNAIIKSGFDIIKEVTNLEHFISNSDIVFTAEGKIDSQTQFGKTPFGVAQIAQKYNKPCIAIAGTIGDGTEILLQKGITAYFSISNKPMSLADSMLNADKLLENTAEQIYRLMLAC